MPISTNQCSEVEKNRRITEARGMTQGGMQPGLSVLFLATTPALCTVSQLLCK